jgi:hypothetical protein
MEMISWNVSIDPRRTTVLGSEIDGWETLPLSFLPPTAVQVYSYGYIGTEDRTMFPLLAPGAFVQIDESQNRVTKGPWRSIDERPIYFVETREGFRCCWCLIEGDLITLQGHPQSSEPVRVCRHPQQAEVLGRVVAAAMRFPLISPRPGTEWGGVLKPEQNKAGV